MYRSKSLQDWTQREPIRPFLAKDVAEYTCTKEIFLVMFVSNAASRLPIVALIALIQQIIERVSGPIFLKFTGKKQYDENGFNIYRGFVVYPLESSGEKPK